MTEPGIIELDATTELQRTPDWFAARLGKVTASRTADVMARTKTGYAASRANYMADLLCERLTEQRGEGFTSFAMQWGIDKEPLARAVYEARTGNTVTEVGFVDHPMIDNFGASPDGEVGQDGLIEIKCPNTATHLDMMVSETVPQKYMIQMQVQMACTDRAWCDFVSYDPRLPEELSIWITRVHRDDDLITQIEAEVQAFLDELDAKIKALRDRFSPHSSAASAA